MLSVYLPFNSKVNSESGGKERQQRRESIWFSEWKAAESAIGALLDSVGDKSI